jgi:hypothetical protein
MGHEPHFFIMRNEVDINCGVVIDQRLGVSATAEQLMMYKISD